MRTDLKPRFQKRDQDDQRGREQQEHRPLVLEKFYNPTAIDNLLVGVRQAIRLVEDNPGAREWKKSITELPSTT